MRYLLACLFCCHVILLIALDGGSDAIKSRTEKALEYKQNCAQSTAQTDLDINNVRARLVIGGAFGWDGSQARYIVPNLGPGQPEVSSLFAGGIWLGGVDPSGNLKLAAQSYGAAAGKSDYWPGTLTEDGTTESETCENWDRFFTVTSADIDLHITNFRQAQEENTAYDVEWIPENIKEWPGLGNEFFFEQFGFHLPTSDQGLAPFWDENQDGMYTPQYGDYPIIEIRGCGSPRYADQMTYWIFNDAGNVHTESTGRAMQMEIQAQSFAFATNDPLDDMTFSRYKLINRAPESINDTYFGVWLDPDLGCGQDDFIGCDTLRDLMYVYNSDAMDGNASGDCPGGVPTYGDEIPYLGVDFFQGLLAPKVFGENGELINPELGQTADTIVELGMTSFIYNIDPPNILNTIMTSPNTAQDHYNYLSGSWRTGLPMTVSGSGFGGEVKTKFAFHDEPNDEDGWSMCSALLPMENMKTIQSSGPFRLNSGQINELIIGIPWVPDVVYPCPDMSRLFEVDDMAQALFDNCLLGISSPNSTSITENQKEQLDQITVYPNPSLLSTNSNSSHVNITNLPVESLVTIYTLDGKVVKQYKIDKDLQQSSIVWDLRSEMGLDVISGLHLIHIKAKGIGERVIKLSVVR